MVYITFTIITVPALSGGRVYSQLTTFMPKDFAILTAFISERTVLKIK